MASALLLLASGCGDVETSSSCSPQTCVGCCQGELCVALPTASACGLRGSACVPCAAGQQCDLTTGRCSLGCDATSCAGGCCIGDQCVQPGNLPTACGTAGQACASCNASQQCVDGQCREVDPSACNPSNCVGCCLGGRCQQRISDQACGINGSPCIPCPLGTRCDSRTGQCVRGDCIDCAASGGCCKDNACYPGTSVGACGSGGQPCDICSATETCWQGTCQPATTTCNAQTCANSCCTPEGCAQSGIANDLSCGVGGNACVACAPTESCQLGACVPQAAECMATCHDGCCYGGQCIPYIAQDDTRCGIANTLCAPCPANKDCDRLTGKCDDGLPNPCTSSCLDKNTCCDISSCRIGSFSGLCGSYGRECELCTVPSDPCLFDTTLNTYRCQSGTYTYCNNCDRLDRCCSGSTCTDGTVPQSCGSFGSPCQSCSGPCILFGDRYTCQRDATSWDVCFEYAEVDCASSPACQSDSSAPQEIYLQLKYSWLGPTWVETPNQGYFPGEVAKYYFGNNTCLTDVSNSDLQDGLYLAAYEEDDSFPDISDDKIAECYISPSTYEKAVGYVDKICGALSVRMTLRPR